MKKHDYRISSEKKFSRRNFIATAGVAAAGLALNPFKNLEKLFASTRNSALANPVKVGITQAFNYDRDTIQAKVQGLFEAIGGISDVVKKGDKVAIKINMTGGNGAINSALKDISPIETIWTHPEVLRAVVKLLLDSGVLAQDIYIVEALWDTNFIC